MSQSDKWLLIYGREKAKKLVASNTALVILRQCQYQESFQRNIPGVILTFLLIIFKGWQCFLFIREHFLSFEKM